MRPFCVFLVSETAFGANYKRSSVQAVSSTIDDQNSLLRKQHLCFFFGCAW